MDWITILISVIGAIGGIGGIVTIYHAKSNKDAIDINNFHALIEEERTERRILKEDYDSYKQSVNQRIAEVKLEVAAMKRNNDILTMSVQSAFRCPLVENVDDCVVWSTYDKLCKDCNKNNSYVNDVENEAI